MWDTVRMLYIFLSFFFLFLIEITSHYVKANNNLDNEVIYQNRKSQLFSL
jgi:hypothetical protein